MTNTRTGRFTVFVPTDEPEKEMPPALEVLDYHPPRQPGKKKLPAGAYDPYERPPPSGNTVRVRIPRANLRQLSEWIKTTKNVEAMRDEEPPAKDTPRKR